nr:C-type lectin domain family 2 member E-like isoform X1 [Pogona vitticeps]
MAAPEAGSTDPCLPLDSNRAENGAVNGHIKQMNGTIKEVPFTEFPMHGFQCCEKRRAPLWTVVSLICNAVFLIPIIILSVVLISERRREAQLCSPTAPVHSCPDGWIGYRKRCYYFAEAEGDWEFSRKNCSAFDASLAVIDSQEELDFLRRYKTSADHWIGLKRNEETEAWRWINGVIFNNIDLHTLLAGSGSCQRVGLHIRGRGACAYVNHEGIASSSCVWQEPWICSKPPVS